MALLIIVLLLVPVGIAYAVIPSHQVHVENTITKVRVRNNQMQVKIPDYGWVLEVDAIEAGYEKGKDY